MRTSILDSLHLTNRLASFFVTILSLPFSLARDREGVLVQRAAIVDVDSNYLYASFSPFPFSFFRSFLFLFFFFFFFFFEFFIFSFHTVALIELCPRPNLRRTRGPLPAY